MVGQSLAGNFTLRQAVARIEQANASAEQAGARRYPAVNVTGTDSLSSGLKNTQTHQLLAQASYEIDFWGKNRASAGAGLALAEAAGFDADIVAMTQAAIVADTYLQILSLGDRIALATHLAADARRVLALIQLRRHEGTATELQVAQQRVVVAGLDAAVPVLTLQQDQARHLLATLVGRPPQGFHLAVSGMDGVRLPALAPGLPARLLERRPDIRAAEARLRAANFDIGIARAAFFPSVSLSATMGIGANSLTGLGPPALLNTNAVSLLLPLFLGGQLEGQLRFSKAKQIELVAAYRQTILSALQDAEDELSALAQLQVQESRATEGAAAALQAKQLGELQYRLGSADYLTILSTQQAYYQAQDVVLQVRLLRFQAFVGLARALGGGFSAASGPDDATGHKGADD